MISKKMIDEFTEKNGTIKIAIAGAGYITKGLMNQIKLSKQIEVVALASRTKEKAIALVDDPFYADTLILDSVYEIPNCEADIIVDLTGDVEVGAIIAQQAIMNRKHIVCSAETDATVGPVLAKMAREAGVIYSGLWGDEPGLLKGLYDYADVLGFEIMALGKFKGFLDHYATPESVAPFAEKSKQNPIVISSFADGSKLAMEMSIVCNATGVIPDVQGMHLPKGTFEEVLDLLKFEHEGGLLRQKGIIEVVLGPEPSGAVFAIIRTDNKEIIESLKYYKMGDGPNYMLYLPYHLPGIEMLYGIFEMMVLNKSVIEPLERPVADVMTFAKRDLNVGERLGAIGDEHYFGKIEKAEVAMMLNALPLGLAAHGIVQRPIKKGMLITLDDVLVCEHDNCMTLRQQYTQLMENKYDSEF